MERLSAIILCLGESWFFLILMSACFSVHAVTVGKDRHISGRTCIFFLYLVCSCLCLYPALDPVPDRLIMGVIGLILLLVFTEGQMAKKIFWQIAFLLFSTIAENAALEYRHQLLTLRPEIFGFLANVFHNWTDYIISAVLYLFLFFLFVYLCVRLQKIISFIPAYLLALFLAVIYLGYMAQSTYSLTMTGLQSSYGKNLPLEVRELLLQDVQTSETIQILLLVLFFALMVYACILYRRNIALIQQAKEREIDEERLKALSEANHALRVWKHENVSHLQTCRQLLENGEAKTCIGYLCTLLHQMNTDRRDIRTGNAVIDAVLSCKLADAQAHHISLVNSVILPEEISLPIEDTELSAVLACALDNAVEACLELPDNRQRYIHTTIKILKSSFFLQIKNSSGGNYNQISGGIPATTKERADEDHGIGLRRIAGIAERAGGFLKLCPGKDQFTFTLILPLKNGGRA